MMRRLLVATLLFLMPSVAAADENDTAAIRAPATLMEL